MKVNARQKWKCFLYLVLVSYQKKKHTYHDFSNFFSTYDAMEKNPLFRSWRQWNLIVVVFVVVVIVINRERESASRNTRCSLSRRAAQWHGLIYVTVWVHRYFLHGRGPLHAGHLPSITDYTFSNFAGNTCAYLRCIIFVASSGCDGDSFSN